MDIVSPKTLWRDYDRRELPLDESVVSDRTADGVRDLRVYFNGLPEAGACARIFARLVMPLGDNLPVCLLMRDTGVAVDDVDASHYTRRGYAVLIVDYAGKTGKTPFHTIYPDSLEYANFTNECLIKAPRDPRNNCWIVWAKVMLRGITYIESVGGLDADRITVIGESVASSCVWKACVADSRILCGVSLFDSRFKPENVSREEAGEDEDESIAYLGYEAALIKASYAPYIKMPLLVLAASNDQYDVVENISEAYSLIPKSIGCRLSISERMNRAIGFKQSGNFWRWIDHYAKGEGVIPKEPTVTASCSDHKLYFEVKSDGEAETELFVSQAMEHSSMRNWHSCELEQTGEGEYISRQDIYKIAKPVYAFANIYSGGFSFSSPILEKLPAQMGVSPSPVSSTRLIYDSEMGVDDWTVDPDRVTAQAEMVKGPFDIEGVSGAGGSLMTYKLADVISGGDGRVLQVSLFSSQPQEVNFSVIIMENEDGEIQFVTYRTTLPLSPEDNWRRINFKPSDFKSESGICQGWEGIVSLKVDSGIPVVVKSVLWV